MIKTFGVIFGSSASKHSIFYNPILLQSIRWKKRRWIPPHPSKQFFVPEKKTVDPEELSKLTEMSNIYNTNLKSLMKYFEEEKAASKLKRQGLQPHQYARPFTELMKENELWNEECARLRKERQEKHWLDTHDERMKKLLSLEQQENMRKERAKRMVSLEQEAAKHFINLDNLEEEIEKALDARASYNFAIDLEGNQHFGMPEGQHSENDAEYSESSEVYS